MKERKVGYVMPDGTIYASISPDTGKSIYTTPKDAGPALTWERAIAFAVRLDAHGHKDWRVPSKGELNVLFKIRASSLRCVRG
jgi:hypothetical protein